jgi:hypothetical protein
MAVRVVVISAVRLVVLLRTDTADDITWTAINECVWSIVECNVAIVSACLPTLKPIFGSTLGICHLFRSFIDKTWRLMFGKNDAVSLGLTGPSNCLESGSGTLKTHNSHRTVVSFYTEPEYDVSAKSGTLPDAVRQCTIDIMTV